MATKSSKQQAYEKILDCFSKEVMKLSQQDYFWIIEELLAHLEGCYEGIKEEMNEENV